MENGKENAITEIKTMVPSFDGSIEGAVGQAEKFFELQDRTRKAALNLTSITDWIDEGGKPYLQWQGTAKVARGFGVSYSNPKFSSEIYTDDKGECLEITVTGDVVWNGQTITEMGTGTSRDSFFGVRNGAFLPLSEVDRTDIKKKALTNFLNRGLKSLLGLSFTWEEIETVTKGRITRKLVIDAGGGVRFDKGKKGGNTDTPEIKEKKSQLRIMILDIVMGDQVEAKKYLVGKTAFNDYKGAETVDSLSEKQLNIVFSKVKADHEAHLKKVSEQGAA